MKTFKVIPEYDFDSHVALGWAFKAVYTKETPPSPNYVDSTFANGKTYYASFPSPAEVRFVMSRDDMDERVRLITLNAALAKELSEARTELAKLQRIAELSAKQVAEALDGAIPYLSAQSK